MPDAAHLYDDRASGRRVGVCLNLTGEKTQERIATAFDDEGYQRLQAIKRAVDPSNRFRFNQNISSPADGYVRFME